MTPGLERFEIDPAAREILEIADACRLHPRISASGPGAGDGSTTIIIDSRQDDGLFGTITINAAGTLTHAHLVHGNWGQERRFNGVAEVRPVITSWAALTSTPVPAVPRTTISRQPKGQSNGLARLGGLRARTNPAEANEGWRLPPGSARRAEAPSSSRSGSRLSRSDLLDAIIQ